MYMYNTLHHTLIIIQSGQFSCKAGMWFLVNGFYLLQQTLHAEIAGTQINTQ